MLLRELTNYAIYDGHYGLPHVELGIQYRIENETIQLNILDFSGQQKLRAAHHIFFSHRCLYLFIIDASSGEQRNRINYWLKTIEKSGSGSPVVIIENEKEQNSVNIDLENLQINYNNIAAVKKISPNTIMEDLNSLRKAINSAILSLSHIDEPHPLSWYLSKIKLLKVFQSGKVKLAYHEYEELCRSQGLVQPEEQKSLIYLLHDLGIVLFHKDNILDLSWFANNSYRIITHDLIENGILESDMLSQIFREQVPSIEEQDILLKCMYDFELCFPLEQDEKSPFIFPDFLLVEKPYTGVWDNALIFRYQYLKFPDRIISRLIVCLFDCDPICWEDGMVLTFEGKIALIEAEREKKKILIMIRKSLDTDSPGDSSHTQRKLLEFIRYKFNHIHDQNFSDFGNIQVKEEIFCPNSERFLDYQAVLDREENGEDYILVSPGIEVPIIDLFSGVSSL